MARFSVLLLLALCSSASAAFRAGTALVDVSPKEFPVIINGMFEERVSNVLTDPVHARAIVLDDGQTKIAVVIVDNLMMPRELLDEAKSIAHAATGIPPERMLIAATHTHSAPSVMGCLGSDKDERYAKTLPPLIAKSIDEANKNLQPAKVGHGSAMAPEQTATRRWIFRPDRVRVDPFGVQNMRANMHPGYQSADAIGPTGPPDPEITILSLQTADGKPLAVLANYSMHYYGSTPVSADYFAKFCSALGKLIDPEASAKPLVILSAGTSGDSYLADYSLPKARAWTIDSYSKQLAETAFAGWKKIEHKPDAKITMKESLLPLKRRVPTEERLAWSKERVAKLAGKKPRAQPDIYAREQIFLHEEPQRELKLQAIAINDFAITALPNEVYALTGLKLKLGSPLPLTMNIELANGADGYIPPPEQYPLGGYTTWPARTAGLEVQAESKITEEVLKLLESVAGKPRRSIADPPSKYADAILAAKPIAYYRLGDPAGNTAIDAVGQQHATHEANVLHFLEGPPLSTRDSGLRTNRSSHYVAGRTHVTLSKLGPTWSAELWFWNGMPTNARPVTGYFLSRGKDADKEGPADHLGIGGTHAAAGKLIFFNGNTANALLEGKSQVPLRTWNHVAFVRDGDKVKVYLNGQLEIDGAAPGAPADVKDLYLGARSDNFAPFEGKLDEFAVFDRALSPAEVKQHFESAGIAIPTAQRQADPLTPEQALKSFKLQPGYEIQLVAAEPLVRDPVAIDWSADGKLWVVEMADYPSGIDGRNKPGGRVVYLEDTDGDGRYDKSTTFLDGLNMPTGILAWRDGVLIAAAPEILFAADTNGDGKADVRKTLFKGFKEGNPQLRINGLRFGLDNWVYCANGWSGGVVVSELTGQKIDLGKRDLRINPDTGEMQLLSGVSQFGRNRDDFHNWLGVDNSHPFFHYVLEDRYLARNPHMPAIDPKQQLTARNPKVYPISRGQKRFHSWDQANHFTSACSTDFYRDTLLFDDGKQHAFVCEPVHNLVQQQILTPDGVSFKATRVEDNSDFLSSPDMWFRPVMNRTGPDGSLWVVDMYRYVVEHPDWLNDTGKSELGRFWRDGDDRGRIYRIVRTGKPLRPTPRLDKLTPAQLVDALDTDNGFTRDLAQRLLYWKRDASTTPALENLVRSHARAATRAAALHAVESPSDDLLQQVLKDADANVRVAGLRLAESRPALVQAMVKLSFDPSPAVRLQLACSLGEFDDVAAAGGLAMLTLNADQPFFTPAVLSSVSRHFQIVLNYVLSNDRVLRGPLFPALASMALARNDHDATLAILLRIRSLPPDHRILTLGRWIETLTQRSLTLDKVAKADPRLAKAIDEIRPILDGARTAAVDPTGTNQLRHAALAMLGFDAPHHQDDLNLAKHLLTPTTPTDLQLAAIQILSRINPPSLVETLTKDWDTHTPAIRQAAVDACLAREPSALALLRLIEQNKIPATDIDTPRRSRLQRHANAEIKTLATKLFSSPTTGRDAVVQQFRPALDLKGNPTKGKSLFALHCSACHRLDDVGHDLGPNLLSTRGWTAEQHLTAILDPDRAVEPRFVAYSAVTPDNQSLYGLITNESPASITIKQLDATEVTLPRATLKSLTSSNRSLMPLGFETLSPQEVADLISYLQGN